MTFTVVILLMAGVSLSWVGKDDLVVSKEADVSLPLPSTVTSNGKLYNVVHDMLLNSRYIYDEGFDQKGYLINTSWEANHLGFDFKADKQTEVKAVCGGIIKKIKTASKALDKYVEIEHRCGGKTFLGFYGHIDADPGLKEGSLVPADTLKIGTVADWGTNSHLHLSIFVGGDSEWWRNFYCRKNEYTEETLEGKTVRTLSSCTAVAPAKNQAKDYYTLLSGWGWLKKSVSCDTKAKAYLYVPRQTIIDWGWRDPVDVLLNSRDSW